MLDSYHISRCCNKQNAISQSWLNEFSSSILPTQLGVVPNKRYPLFQELKKIGFIAGTKYYGDYLTNDFDTPSGKVELYSSYLEKWGFDPLPKYHEPPESPLSAPELAGDYPLGAHGHWRL